VPIRRVRHKRGVRRGLGRSRSGEGSCCRGRAVERGHHMIPIIPQGYCVSSKPPRRVPIPCFAQETHAMAFTFLPPHALQAPARREAQDGGQVSAWRCVSGSERPCAGSGEARRLGARRVAAGTPPEFLRAGQSLMPRGRNERVILFFVLAPRAPAATPLSWGAARSAARAVPVPFPPCAVVFR
jgi:hypothetical protein